VAPHGVLELPAIFVAGGLGFHIATGAGGLLTGRCSARLLADRLRRAYRVLLGLAVVLVVAALIEAFLTPRIAAAVLG
ncbi:MAG: stage II sporulation protein M, partial [Halonotius sp.]